MMLFVRFLFAVIEVLGFLVPAFPAHLAHRLCVLGAYAALHVAGMTRRYVVWKRAVPMSAEHVY